MVLTVAAMADPFGPVGDIASSAASPAAAPLPAGAIPSPYDSMIEPSGAMLAVWLTAAVLGNVFAAVWLVRAFFLYCPGQAERVLSIFRKHKSSDEQYAGKPGLQEGAASNQKAAHKAMSTTAGRGFAMTKGDGLESCPNARAHKVYDDGTSHMNANSQQPSGVQADLEQPLDPVSELLIDDHQHNHHHGHHRRHTRTLTGDGASRKVSRVRSLTPGAHADQVAGDLGTASSGSIGVGGSGAFAMAPGEVVPRHTTVLGQQGAWGGCEDAQDADAFPEVFNLLSLCRQYMQR